MTILFLLWLYMARMPWLSSLPEDLTKPGAAKLRLLGAASVDQLEYG